MIKRFNWYIHNLHPLQKDDTVAIQNQPVEHYKQSYNALSWSAVPNQCWWISSIFSLNKSFLNGGISNFIHSYAMCTARSHMLCQWCSSYVSKFPKCSDTHAIIGHIIRGTYTTSCPRYTQSMSWTILWAFSRLLPRNTASNKKTVCLCRALPKCEGGKERYKNKRELRPWSLIL